MECVAQKAKSTRVIADELGVPRQTLYRWTVATRPHPAEPCVGPGNPGGEDQGLRARVARCDQATTSNTSISSPTGNAWTAP